MIKGYFGTPGVGKTTNLVKIARKEQRRLIKRYKTIYTVNCDIKGCIRITKQDFEKYRFEDALILWDEITLDYDNRDFKSFSPEAKQSWLLHRHIGLDVIYVTQNFENVDKKIRDLTIELWYMQKSVVPFLRNFTTSKRIYRQININELSSELTLGYRFCTFLESIFVHNFEICYRKRYYKFFDSFDLLELEKRDLYEVDNVKNVNVSVQFTNFSFNWFN